MQNTQERGDLDEIQIDFVAIFDWLVHHWQRLVMGAASGLVIALLAWWGLVGYKSQMVLVNQDAINFIAWKSLSKSLPALAQQSLDAQSIAQSDADQFRAMARSQWWAENVSPTYSLSKADTKDLVSMSKQMTEAGGDTILNFVVSAKASSKSQSEKDVSTAVRFIQQGVAFLSLQSIISGYETQVLNADSSLRKNLVQSQIELKYLKERAVNLERLRERFPGNTAVANQQVVDLKDASAKFMPISTQLVAVQSDINAILEQLARLQDQQVRLKVMADFVNLAKPLLAKDFNGQKLVDQLLLIEQDLRSKADAQDINVQQALNSIQAQLVSTKTFFSKGLETRLAPTTTKSMGMVGPALGGLFLGLMVMLASLWLPNLRQRLRR